MRVSLHWMREWADPGDDVPGLAHALTMAGLEIEGVESAAPALEKIVVGEIVARTAHPDAEKLSVCQVSVGNEQFQIVCGASNAREGLKAPLALLGAKLPNGTEIKKAKLRGVESFGMLCSARELGLSEDQTGLLELPESLVPGTNLVSALALDDNILSINLTPNRGDCMSMMGVAREVAAARKVALRGPKAAAVMATMPDKFPIRLEASEGCPKLVGRVLRGLRADAKSPLWMRERLRRAGVRSISAMVDVTNYVMLELGQPMHAYDLRVLEGALIVRWAKAGETLQLLDGRTIELSKDVLVIADERKVLGLAGVMGGDESGIGAATTDVFLEAAYFGPDAVAGRGRRYGLVTDASQRFERGVDPMLQERAIERATQLLLEIAGGGAGPIEVAGVSPAATSPINLRAARVTRLLGVEIAPAKIAEYLQRVGITLKEEASHTWQTTIPRWRFDLRIEEDLIEEVARLHGYDHIPAADPVATVQMGKVTETRVSADRAADLLVDRGYQEAITYSFADPKDLAPVSPGQTPLVLKNPISAELAAMRTSLWPGLLIAARENQRRQQPRVRLFEIGRKYASMSGAETNTIAGVATGKALPESWAQETTAVDFFDVKADVEALLRLSGEGTAFEFVASVHPALHPGQSAQILRDGHPIGWLGVVHPEVAKQLDLTYGPVVFELETLSAFAARIPEYTEISKFPSIRRDLAVIVDESVSLAQLEKIARAAAGKLLQALAVLSVYRGEPIEKGKKSIALGLNLQDTSRTLTDSDADALVAQVVSQLGRDLKATIRD